MANQKPLVVVAGGVRQIAAGDVLAVPGSKVEAASGNAVAQLDCVVGAGSLLVGSRGGNTRWQLALGNATAEPGANVGADFSLGRYSDAGAFIATALLIARSSGTVTINGALQTGSSVQSGTGWVGRAGSAGATSNLFNLNWTGSAMQLWVDSTNIGSISVTSDESVKHTINPLVADRASYLAIQPISYRYRNVGVFEDLPGDEGEYWGFSAQNLVQANFHKAVQGASVAQSGNGTQQPMNVLDRPILAQTVLHVQALMRENDELRSLITKLTERLDALEPNPPEIS